MMKKILFGLLILAISFAREVEYNDQEVLISVLPKQPTYISFPSTISSGWANTRAGLDIKRKENDMIIFAQDNLNPDGEAMIVRLDDGRSFAMRIKLAADPSQRDDIIVIEDYRKVKEDEEVTKKFEKAPTNSVSGLMREMILAAEFGKRNIPGFRASDKHRGETILNDGTLEAKIDTIFLGPDLWGYVVNVSNLLDQTQKINPASFRLDGTRAVSLSNWELAPRAINVENQIARKDVTKVYIITTPKGH